MNAHFCGKPVAHRLAALALEAIGIPEIGIDRIDRLDIRRACADETEGARQPVGPGRITALIAIGMSAERGCQILHAPGDAEEPLARLPIGVEMKERRGGLGDDSDDGRPFMLSIAYQKLGESHDVDGRFRLGQHDPLRTSRQNRRYIIRHQP